MCLLAAWISQPYSGQIVRAQLEALPIPLLSDIPLLEPSLFDQNILAYLGYIAIPIMIHVLFFYTRHCINLRAVCENPAAADAAVVAVQSLRFIYVAI